MNEILRQSFSQTLHTVLGTSVKLQSETVVQDPVCQTSVFGTFPDKKNVSSEVSTFHESSIVVDGKMIEGSMKARPSLSDDSTSKDDLKKREIKSLVPDYNSDQSSYVDSKSNLSTEELRKDDNLNEEECAESMEQKDKSEIPMKSNVSVSHEPS